MRGRVIGATLTILGVLSVLFAPEQVDYSVRVGLLSYGSYSFWQLIQWPPGWSWAFLPMVIIGGTLVLTALWGVGGGMGLRVLVAGLTVMGVWVFFVVLEQVHHMVCVDFLGYGSYSFWEFIQWPPGWSWAFLPMLIIGGTLVLTGM